MMSSTENRTNRSPRSPCASALSPRVDRAVSASAVRSSNCSLSVSQVVCSRIRVRPRPRLLSVTGRRPPRPPRAQPAASFSMSLSNMLTGFLSPL